MRYLENCEGFSLLASGVCLEQIDTNRRVVAVTLQKLLLLFPNLFETLGLGCWRRRRKPPREARVGG